MSRTAGSPANFDFKQTARARDAAKTAAHVLVSVSFIIVCLFASAAGHAAAQDSPTPQQREIERQRARLSSADMEERRDAVTRLGAMNRSDASRAAVSALGDSSAIVRATAARAILSIGAGEASTLLVPLLRDRDAFVRREAAYALGRTRHRYGVPQLTVLLETDKEAAVRGAAAVALGEIADPAAAPALAASISRRLRAPGFFNRIRRRRVEEDEFVRRSAAIALGRLASREAVPVLVATLADERAPDDLRREAARALGLIGDPAAIPALRSVLAARDPYLATIAHEALRKLDPAGATRPT